MNKRGRALQEKIDALREGKKPKVDLRQHLRDERVGDVPGPDIRAVFLLARAYQQVEDPDAAATSWVNQEKAETFFDANGLAATLDEAVRLGAVLTED